VLGFTARPGLELVELAVGRKELLRIYYGEKALEDLIKVKQSFDINNVLDFPMGIPTS